MSNILQIVSDFVEPYINSLMAIFNDLEFWMQGVVLLVIAIFVVIGLFVFMKKFIVLFIVLAIIGGAVYYVYTKTDLLSGLIGYASLFSVNMFIF